MVASTAARSRQHGARMGGHAVGIERRSGDGFTRLERGGSVRPGEAIRIIATGLKSNTTFRIFNSGGNLVHGPAPALATIGGSAWLDIAAPRAMGAYELIADDKLFFLVPIRHDDAFPFQVSSSAPDPIAPPPKTGPFGEIKDIAKLVLFGIGGFIILQVVQVVRR